MTIISATYHLTCEAAQVEQFSRDIAFEQTVEVPPEFITSQAILDQVVGRVVGVHPLSEQGRFEVRIEYNADLACSQLPQLLNLVYGNISIKKGVRLFDLEFPVDFLRRFRGPNFGIPGVRKLLGVHERPLLATALKPRGSKTDTLAQLAYEFALGGGDLVKDDHNLVDQDYSAFCERVLRCRDAVVKANRQTGRNTLYLPNLMGPQDELEKRLEFIALQELSGVLISPMIAGLDVLRYLAGRYSLVFMAHPAFSGTFFNDPGHGMTPALLLGKLFRIAGADISVFPNYGGRFAFTENDCQRLSHELRAPMENLAPAFPAPAGGMGLQNLAEMARQYGEDAVYLIGAALLRHSHNLEKATDEFQQEIRRHFAERLEPPQTVLSSACEYPIAAQPEIPAEYLRFSGKFAWEGREPRVYKASQALPFRDVIRHELIGNAGERTSFELRYFEIAPGGYSSLEKHVHTHVIIGVRGSGILLLNERKFNISLNDIAYIPPLAVHQLRNEEEQPFGFFCIVDRERDRPMEP